jgi:hypothetical protein
MAGFRELAAGLPNLRRTFEKFRFWETAAGDRVRYALRELAVKLAKMIAHRAMADGV